MSTHAPRPTEADRSAAPPPLSDYVITAPPHVDLPDECVDVEQVPAGLRDRALAEGNAPLALVIYGLMGAGLGLVFTKSQVEGYIALKMEELEAYEMTPHPVEFALYYSC